MKEVSLDLFRMEKISISNGNVYTLLHYQRYQQTIIQVDTPRDIEEWRRHMNAAMDRGGFVEYVSGHYDHLVFSVGADKAPKITQANAEEVGKAIHMAIIDVARWWCTHTISYRKDAL